jgi:hypothetical protein
VAKYHAGLQSARRELERAVGKKGSDKRPIEQFMAAIKVAKQPLQKEICKVQSRRMGILAGGGRQGSLGSGLSDRHQEDGCEDYAHRAVAKLFPTRLERHRPMPPVATSTQFTLDELRAAAERLRGGKAPGPDGVPAEPIKLAVTTAPEEISGLPTICSGTDISRNHGRWENWSLSQKRRRTERVDLRSDPSASWT